MNYIWSYFVTFSVQCRYNFYYPVRVFFVIYIYLIRNKSVQQNVYQVHIKSQVTAGNRHKQNSWFCKEIREDNFRFGGGEFTKMLRKVCTCQKLKFSFLLLEYCKIRECYAVANAFTIRNMYSLFLYIKCNSRKINRPTKNMTKIVTLLHF
jgi:hypothetical protein